MSQAARIKANKSQFLFRIILLIFLIRFCSVPAFATVEKEQFPGSLTCKQIDSLIKEAVKYKSFDLAQYRFLSHQALTLARGLPCKKLEALALLHLGSCNINEEKYFDGFSCYFESLDLYSDEHDIDGVISVLSMIVYSYLQISDEINALEYLKKTEIFLKQTSDPLNIGRYYYNKSLYCYQTNRLDEAESSSYLGILYYSKANAFTEKARILKLLGDIKLRKKDYTRSLYFYSQSIDCCSELGDISEIAVLYTRKGHVFQLLHNYEEVLKYNYKALVIREKTGPKELVVSSLINTGGTYLSMGKYDSAAFYLFQGISLAKNINRTLLLEHAYMELSRFYTTTGNPKKALESYSKYSGYHRKLIEDQNDNEIRKLEESRKIKEVEIRNDLLKKKNELQWLQYRTSMIQTILLEILFLFATAFVIVIYILRKQAIASRTNLIALNKQLKKEIGERVQAEVKLRESEELYRFLAEHSVDVITHMDRNLNRKYISPSCKTVLGYEPHELLNKNPLSIIDPQDHHIVQRVSETMKKTRAPGNLLYRVITKDGQKKWVDVTINPIFDPVSGELKELLSTLRDVNERILYEEAIAQNARQKEILLREIHTRVKNNFAVLISLMDLQKASSGNQGLLRSLTDLQLRVRTMSLVHEQLYISEDIRSVQFHNYLLTLVSIICNAYKKESITLKTEFSECLCDIEMALPLGLIVNELLTNAFKYAFPGNTSGTVWVTLKKYEADEGREEGRKDIWVLRVCDDGIGLPDFFTTEPKKGMGTQIVGILVDQIEAKMNVVNRNGACFTLIFSNSDEMTGISES